MEFKRGQRVKTDDGREGVLVRNNFGMWQVDFGQTKEPFSPEQLTHASPPESTELPDGLEDADKAVAEGQLNAYLGLAGGGADTLDQALTKKYPDLHLFRCMKKGAHATDQDASFWRGHGCKLVSEDVLETRHEGIVLMGIPKYAKAALDKAVSEQTNGWAKEYTKADAKGKNRRTFKAERVAAKESDFKKPDLAEAWS